MVFSFMPHDHGQPARNQSRAMADQGMPLLPRLLIKAGVNARLPGSVLPLPGAPGTLLSVSGAQLIITSPEGQQTLRGHSGYITAFALGRRGVIAVTGEAGRTADVVIWDLLTGQVKSRFCEHNESGICSLALSHDERLCLSVGHAKDQRLFVLDTSTGAIVCKHNLEWGKQVTTSAFSSVQGETYSFAVAYTGDLVLYALNPYNGMLSPRPVTAGSVRRVYTSLCFSPDGQWLYCGTASGDVVTVNVLRAAVQLTHPACSNGVGAMVLSSSGRLLVAGGDGSITLFSNDHMWQDVRPFVSVPGPISSMAPTDDGSALIAATSDGMVWRVNSGSFSVEPISQGHAGPITRVAAPPQVAGFYATASQDGRVMVFSSADHSLQQTINADPSAGIPLSLAMAPGIVVSGWADGALRAHALQPPVDGYGKGHKGGATPALWVVPGAHQFAHSIGVNALAVSNNGTYIATGGEGGEIRIWDSGRRTMVGHMKQHTGRINQVAILVDDMHLVAAGEDKCLTAWDTATHRCRATWSSTGAIRSVASAGDQVILVSGGHEPHFTIWDLRSPDPVHVVKNAHAGGIGAVAAVNNSPLLATGGIDSLLRLWDLRATSSALSCQPLAVGTAHTGPITSLAFTPGGRLLSGGADGAVVVWQP